MQRNDLLAWMDLEMTSIENVMRDKITEIVVVLTDQDLNIVAESPDIIINVDDTLFEGIAASAEAVHEINGLRELSRQSITKADEAEEQILAFLKKHIVEGTAPLCGNSIHMDRHFLRVQMPSVDNYLFYRCIDVSTLKELARRWSPEIYEEAKRRKAHKNHRAKDDVLASINELKFYREKFLKLQT
jgi:oligoribonuclease